MVERVLNNSVEQRAFTGERFQAADFGEGRAIARGAQQFARGLEEAHDNLSAIGEMHDDAVVKNADAEDLRSIMELKATALQAEGLDAPNAVKEANDKIAEIRRTRLATFKNSRQRQLYDDVFRARDLQIQEAFVNHSINETQKAEKQGAIARGEAYADLATETYGTDAFEANMQTTLNEVAAANKGMPPELIARQQAKVRSTVLSKVVSGMLANPDNLQEANAALEANAKDILPDDEEKLRRAINPLMEEDQTETDAGWAISGDPTPEDPTDDLAPLPDAPQSAKQTVKPGDPAGPTGPLHGKGRITNTAQQHRARGSSNALDIAAPEGTPVYPPMSGKVLKNYWSDKGGNQLLIQHPNGYVTGYAHLRTRSPLREGDNVDNTTIIGSVGTTGTHSTGPHLHYTTRQSRGGPKIDPEILDWGSNATNPKNVSWKEGDLVKPEAKENQLGGALQRLYERADRENWSPQRYKRAQERVRQISGVNDQLYNQGQEVLYNGAIAQVVALGDGLTSVSQVPNFSSLSPTRQLQIQNIIKSNKNAGEDPDAASPNYFKYLDAARNPTTREAFIRFDILSDPSLTNGERKELFKMQWDIKNDKTGALTGKMDEASSFANRYLPKKDFNDAKGEQKRQKFMDTYMQRVEAAQQGRNTPLTDREKDDIARALVVPIVRFQETPEGEKSLGKGYFFEYGGPGKERATVNVEEVYASIPQATHDRIRTDLARAGQRHSKQDIVRVYLEQAR